MDPAKRRLFAGIGGALFGFTGIVAMLVSLSLYLTPILGAAFSALVSGGVFVLISAGLLFVFLKPSKSAQAELDQLEDATADALADLPFDTLKNMVEKHPLAMTGLAAFIGYSLASDDNEMGSKTLQRMMFGFL